MRLIICIVSVLISSFVFGQTELIAFKSRSGNMEYYRLSGFDNLGEPPIYIDSILKLNDSTIVEYLSWGYQNDTVVNHPICKLPQSSLDSLKGNYYNFDTQFIDFEKTIVVDTLKKDSVIKAIKTFGESEKKDEESTPISKGDDTPVNPSPQIKSVYPTSKIHLLWYGLLGFVVISILMLWFKFKSKLQM